jgi:hypothetical protein
MKVSDCSLQEIPILPYLPDSYKRRLWPRASSLIEKETLKKRISNNECRMSNVEVMYSVYFKKRQSAATPSFRIPHSDFRIRQM